jgi:hypothetical protein
MSVKEYFPVIEQVNEKLIALGYANESKLSLLNASFRKQAAGALENDPDACLLYSFFKDDFKTGMIGNTKITVPEYSFPGFDVVSLERFLDPEYNGPAETFEITAANDPEALVFPDIMIADPMESLLPANQMHKIIKSIVFAVFEQTETLTDGIYAVGVTLGMTKEEIASAMPLAFLVSKAMGDHNQSSRSSESMGEVLDALLKLRGEL